MDRIDSGINPSYQMPENATYEPVGDSLFQLTLTRENKAEIFEHGISKLAQTKEETTLVLNNLEAWSPSLASRFTRRSTSTILDTPFRLMFPNSALSSFEETGLYVRQYLAISYCWRSDDFLPEGYERHGDWPISRPFVEAILNDKDHPREGIWMDQLCIDQSSSVDKQKSVAAMDIIYRSCIRLLVLLEDVTLDEQEAALLEKYDNTKRKFDKRWIPDDEDRDTFVSFYQKVNAARWWERAWCFHEFNVNEPWSDKRQCNMIHNATFIMGGPAGSTVKIKWVKLLLIMGSALYVVPKEMNTVLSDFKGVGIFTGVERGDDQRNGWKGSIMARQNGVAMMGCKFLADRLSVMINMLGLGIAYVGPEPESKDEVFYISAVIALAAGEVYPLSMFDWQSLMLNDRPSWLVRHLAAKDTSIPKFKLGSVHHIHQISPEEIVLNMVFFTRKWELIKEEDLSPTYQILPDTIATTNAATHFPEAHVSIASQPDTFYDPLRRRFLAGCISNGYAFTARLWAQLKRDVVIPNYNTGVFKDLAPNPSLRTAAVNLIAHLFPVSKLLGISPPALFTVEDAHLFLTWFTDQRSIYYISAYSFNMQCTSDGRRAFITGLSINSQFDDGPADQLQAAIPADMLDATCIPMRVWVLRPVNGVKGGEKWRIVGKALLLGEPDLMSEARASKDREDAVVTLRKAVVGGC